MVQAFSLQSVCMVIRDGTGFQPTVSLYGYKGWYRLSAYSQFWWLFSLFLSSPFSISSLPLPPCVSSLLSLLLSPPLFLLLSLPLVLSPSFCLFLSLSFYFSLPLFPLSSLSSLPLFSHSRSLPSLFSSTRSPLSLCLSVSLSLSVSL